MSDEQKDYELHELSFISSLHDNDLLLIEDVSVGLPLKKIRLCTLRSSFIGGWPRLEDMPEGVVTPPEWSLKGIEGGWRFRIHKRVPDAKWYFIHKWDHASEKYVAVKSIPESRDPHEEGTPQTPLIYDYFAPITDTPNRYYGKFKVQSVSHDYQGALSDSQECWTLYDLPSDWEPDAPTLLTTGGYPLISRAPLPDGGLGYTISLKIQAPADQKNLVKEYIIDRVCDEGDSFEGKPTKTNTLTIKAVPHPKIVIWHDTDRSFVPGHQYRYTVYARALNDNKGPVSNTQDKTLTDDTTAPDDPVFTVTTSPGNIEVVFDPIEVGGNPDVGWAYIQLQYRIDSGDWTDVILDKTLSHVFSIAEADYADEYEFQAKVFDYAGNANEGDWQTDENKYTAGEVSELCFGVDLANKITLISTNEGNISTHETEISQNATDILLRATKTYVDGEVTTLETSIGVNADAIVLKVAKNVGDECEILSEINLNSSGVRIAGKHFAVDVDTTFAADVAIQGILKASGGIKTSLASDRITIGKFGGTEQILSYYDSLVALKIQGGQLFAYDEYEATGLVADSSKVKHYIGYIEAKTHFKVDGTQVVGARGAAVGQSAYSQGTVSIALDGGSDTVDRAGFNTKLATLKTHFDELSSAVNVAIGSINILLIRLGADGHGLTADVA